MNKGSRLPVKHGTYAGYSSHSRHKEKPCEPCRIAQRKYLKDRNDKKRAKQTSEKLPPTFDPRCGTYAGNGVHQYKNEKLCDACAKARREYWREHRKNNLEKTRKYDRDWKREHPESWAGKSGLRRARQLNNGFDNHKPEDVIALYGTDCHICGKAIDMQASRKVGDDGWENSLHFDHVIPLVKGGSHTLENVRPAHAYCNLKKHSK